MTLGAPVEMTDAGRTAMRKAGVKEQSHVETGVYVGEAGNAEFIIVQLDGESLPQWVYREFWRERKTA